MDDKTFSVVLRKPGSRDRLVDVRTAADFQVGMILVIGGEKYAIQDGPIARCFAAGHFSDFLSVVAEFVA